MAVPIINNLLLQAGRCFIKVDPNSKTTGIIFRVSNQGFLIKGII